MQDTMMLPGLGLMMMDETHILIAGSTNCGKTTLLRNFLYAAIGKGGCALYLIDPKQTEFYQYQKYIPVHRYAKDSQEAVKVLEDAIQEMNRRFTKMRRSGLTQSNEYDIYIVIDELADLLISPEAPIIKRHIQKLTQLSRSTNIHLIAATQQPNRRCLSAELTLNFTCRIGMACRSAIESRQIIGQPGCELLPRPNRSAEDQTRKLIYDNGCDEPFISDVMYISPEQFENDLKFCEKKKLFGLF